MKQNFKRQSNKGISHLVLVILIAVGVMIGNLLSAAFIAKYIEHQTRQALTEASKTLDDQARKMRIETQNAQQLYRDQQAATQDALRRQRAKDPNGVKLAKNCSEWRQANANHGSYTTQTEAAKHCRFYEQYLQHGRLPSGQ